MTQSNAVSTPVYSRSSAAVSGAFSFWPIKRYLDHLFTDFLTPVGQSGVDFTKPEGEAALIPADSVSWHLFKNPVSLFIGGVTAVMMELAEPRVGHGVWTHSDFRRAPKSRLQRTGLAAMVSVYGPASTARAMIEGINQRHARVTGTVGDAEAYTALDPELLNWVQATASYGFVESYSEFVRPLTREEKGRAYGEALPVASLYGATLPDTMEAMALYFEGMRPQLERTPYIPEFLKIMRSASILPMSLRFMQGPMIEAAISLVPESIRQQIGINSHLTGWQRSTIRWLGGLADQAIVDAGPAVQACRRLGLPDNYLYRVK